MNLGEAKQVLKSKIGEIKKDDRYRAPAAQYQVNGPLALVQVGLKSRVAAYEDALQVLAKVKS